MARRPHITAACVAMLVALAAGSQAHAAGRPASAKLARALDGWQVLKRPIDRAQQTNAPWGTRSDWLQPWRAYLDTQPASMLRRALGIQFNVPSEHADSTARLLGDSGFARARVEIPWGAMSYDEPSRLNEPQRWETTLRALKAAGIRPLILLNSNDGAPGPHRSFDAQVMLPAIGGARTVVVDLRTAEQLVPGRSALAGLDDSAAPHIVTGVSPWGAVTLSRPVADVVLPGTYRGLTLRYAPFAPPRTADGRPNGSFEDTLDGWLLYVKAVTAKARQVLGADDFDVEIWNELSFGSEFLDAANFYDSVPAALLGTGSVTDALLRRTVAWLRDPANGVPDIGIGNGFASLDPLAAGSTLPTGVTALDKHPYYGGIKPMPGYAGSLPGIRDVNALGQAGGERDAAGNWRRPYLPSYTAFFPEYFLTAISPDFMGRDLSPITTIIDGVAHGRHAKPPGATAAPQVWITETGFRPMEAGPMSAAQARHIQAKAALRTLSAFVNKGARMLNFYAVGDGDWSMVDPSRADGGKTMAAIKRFVGAFAGPERIRKRRSLRLQAIADRSDATQFTGDGTAAHPPLNNRDVVAFLPFQVSTNHFVIPTYVMTRNMARIHDRSARSSDVHRYDLPAERYRFQVAGVDAARLRASAVDPMTGSRLPAKVVSRAGRRAIIEVKLTDAPRLLVLEDGRKRARLERSRSKRRARALARATRDAARRPRVRARQANARVPAARQLGDPRRQARRGALVEGQRIRAGLDHPGALPGRRPDDRRSARQRLATHLAELLGPGLRRPR